MKRNTLLRRSIVTVLATAVLPLMVAGVQAGPQASQSTQLLQEADQFAATNSRRPAPREDGYLLVWAGDQDARQSDFLALIDAHPASRTYGKVLKTFTLPAGSDLGNEPHHMTHNATPAGFVFSAGILSGLTFVWDVKDPLDVKLTKIHKPGIDHPFAAPDDFLVLENGNVMGSYIAFPDLTTPGGIVEFTGDGRIIGAFPGGLPGLYPHGISIKPGINRIVTSDFGRPATFFVATDLTTVALTAENGFTIWDYEKRIPIKQYDLPTGPRFEASGRRIDAAENFAVMEVGFVPGANRRDFYASAMGGGGLYYCPDAAAERVKCKLVYDHGFASGPGNLRFTSDGRYLIMPQSTLRALAGDEPKAVTQFDISNPYRPRVVSEIVLDDDTTGGPHFVAMNASETRISWGNYFIDNAALQFRVDGNHRVYIAERRGFRGEKLALDERFRDEVDGKVGINFNRLQWPHGNAGNAKPHATLFLPSRGFRRSAVEHKD